MHAYRGRKQNVRTSGFGLVAQMPTYFLEQVQVPRRCHGYAAWEQCCLIRSAARSLLSDRILLTGVPLVKNSPLAPFGPSVVLIDGMSLLGIGIDRQKSTPASNDI